MSSPSIGGAQDQNIDPAIAGSGMVGVGAGESGPDENGVDTKKGGRRELSTSKRAAQNRAAQVRRHFLLLSIICMCSDLTEQRHYNLLQDLM